MAAITGELLVTVHAASDLQDCEQWGAMDPYCVLSFTDAPAGAVTATTKTAMKGGTSPVWEETLALAVTSDPGALLVKVFNQNRAAPDDLCGYGRAPVYDVLQCASGELAVPLTAYPSGMKQGYVHLNLAFRPLPADQAEAAAMADMQGEPQEHGHDTELLPDVPDALPTAPEAQQPPALSDLRPLSPRERHYDRVHRPGYAVPGVLHD